MTSRFLMGWPAMALVACANGVACAAQATALPGPEDPSRQDLTAQQIVDRSLQARGGAQAWQGISTMIWTGHLETARSGVPSLAFRLEEKRPGKSRFDINEPSQRSMRIFNGTSGWKMKLGQDGRPQEMPFTPQEVRFARSAAGLEGPLVDYRTRGATIVLEGMEQLEGRQTYRIGLRLPDREVQTVWIDAETFLESRYDRPVYSDGHPKGSVSVRMREYKEVQGLAVPSVIEISGAIGSRPDRMMVEGVALNPVIDEHDFDIPTGSRGGLRPESRALSR